MKKIFFMAVILYGFISPSAAQITPPELQRKIAGKKNLAIIMKEVEIYYKKEEKEKERQKTINGKSAGDEEEFESSLLFWKRWEYFNKTRLKPNGDLEEVAAKTITAWEKVTEKYGNVNRVESGSNPVWNFIGPFNLQYQAGAYRGLCRVDKVVFHPTNPNIFYAGTNNGGLWRTLDGGNTWVNMNFYFPIQSASGIVINPTDPNNIFVLTGDGNGGGGIIQNSCGIWVTHDGGGNWIRTSFNGNAQTNIFNGFKLVMMPGFTNILFAATQNGLYRTTDNGNNWTLVLSGTLLTDGTAPIYDIEFDPAQPGRVYASGFGTFYLSENSGVSFPANQRTNISGATRIEIGVSPANSNYVYLLCGPYTGAVGTPPTFAGTSQFKGIYRSSSGGTANSFSLRANSPNILCATSTGIVAPNDAGDQSSYDLAIDVDKTNAEIITAAGKVVWRSTNGGITLTNLTLFNEGNSNSVPPANYIHPDIHDIAYNPLNNILYACTDGGIYFSSNGGTIWANITNGIYTSTFYHMAGAPFDATRIIGGVQDNGVKYKSNAGDFTHIEGADGFDCSFGPSAASSIYATVNNGVSKYDINGVSQTISQIANTSFFPVIAADPVSDNTVYLAAGTPGIWKSLDGGAVWTPLLNQAIQQSICTCPNNSNRVYVTGTGSIFRTDNGGSNWTPGNLAANPGFINNGQITDINVCSTNSDFVYVTTGGYVAGRKVFYSNDAGANWFNISGTLPAEVKVNCVAIDPFNNAYIGTDMGVYYQAVSSLDWTPFYNELPRVPVTDLAIHHGSGKIRASTYGHGIWETTLFTPCDANFNLTGYVAGDKFYQASNVITSDASILGGSETNVTARAGNEIVLNPGFIVFEYNVFNGILGACESGPVPQTKGRAADIPPLFMNQTDKGDNTTLYSYGTVTVSYSVKGEININIHAVKTGDFSLIITDKEGVNNLISINESIVEGKNILKLISSGNMVKGKYYAQLYCEGRLVHVQEVFVQ